MSRFKEQILGLCLMFCGFQSVHAGVANLDLSGAASGGSLFVSPKPNSIKTNLGAQGVLGVGAAEDGKITVYGSDYQAGADFPVDMGYLTFNLGGGALGVTLTTNPLLDSSGYFLVAQATDQTSNGRVEGAYTYQIGQSDYLRLGLTNVTLTSTRRVTVEMQNEFGYTLDTATASGAAQNSYNDLQFSYSSGYFGPLRLGMSISPEVTVEKASTGEISFVQYDGHGQELVLGIGYMGEQFGVEFDQTSVQKNEKAFLAGQTSSSLSGQMMFGKWGLEGLIANSTYLSPNAGGQNATGQVVLGRWFKKTKKSLYYSIGFQAQTLTYETDPEANYEVKTITDGSMILNLTLDF